MIDLEPQVAWEGCLVRGASNLHVLCSHLLCSWYGAHRHWKRNSSLGTRSSACHTGNNNPVPGLPPAHHGHDAVCAGPSPPACLQLGPPDSWHLCACPGVAYCLLGYRIFHASGLRHLWIPDILCAGLGDRLSRNSHHVQECKSWRSCQDPGGWQNPQHPRHGLCHGSHIFRDCPHYLCNYWSLGFVLGKVLLMIDVMEKYTF